jgi:hypothetical protein
MLRMLLTLWFGLQTSSPFIYQNDFWVNLHQHLFAEAKAGRGAGGTGQAGTGSTDAYATLAKRDPVFDPQLIAINDALGRVAPDAPSLPEDLAIDPAIRAALNLAAPAYRRDVWPGQRQVNDSWIADMKARVDRHGAALTRALAHAYHTDWPSLPILIDVSGEAGQFGAYTTDSGPASFAAHATIAPGGPGAEAEMGFESIFHEASHAVDAAIMKAIDAECAAQHVRAPRNLWHAVIFYTTGELVRRELGKTGDPHYQPYAYRFDVYAKGMLKERAALEQDWQPFLDGKVTYEEALRNLVRDTTSP